MPALEFPLGVLVVAVASDLFLIPAVAVEGPEMAGGLVGADELAVSSGRHGRSTEKKVVLETNVTLEALVWKERHFGNNVFYLIYLGLCLKKKEVF